MAWHAGRKVERTPPVPRGQDDGGRRLRATWVDDGAHRAELPAAGLRLHAQRGRGLAGGALMEAIPRAAMRRQRRVSLAALEENKQAEVTQ